MEEGAASNDSNQDRDQEKDKDQDLDKAQDTDTDEHQGQCGSSGHVQDPLRQKA